ncbi:hypothetical protein F5Y19DRAFT_483389 [Xylariaceae sp. FL1651]|nr:hypothetical protein F5Y19DRAFT_483389 [Xylariaceae sp. FL1651]
MAPDPKLGLSCPVGGQFYVCADSKTRFIGCCLLDPCADGSGHCPTTSLRETSFSRDNHGLLLPQQCEFSVDKDRQNQTISWFCCDTRYPPFLGCSTGNPCITDAGWPTNYLAAAALSDDPMHAAAFIGAEQTGNNTSNDTSTDTSNKPNRSHVNIMVGVPITATIILAIALFFCLHGRKEKNKGVKGQAVGTDTGIAELGDLQRHMSVASSTFMRPRPAPYPSFLYRPWQRSEPVVSDAGQPPDSPVTDSIKGPSLGSRGK